MTLEALIFDVDGTLADTEEQHRLAFNAAFERFSLDWRWDRELYRELLLTPGGKERLAKYIAGRGAGAGETARLLERIPEIHAEKVRIYVAALSAGAIRPRDGVRELLAEARTAGIRLAIATTTSTPNVSALIETAFGGRDASPFEVVACGEDVARLKPAPDVYELVLRKLGVAPRHAVAFEDSDAGLRAATAAGLWTVVTPTFWTEGGDFGAAGLVRESLAGLGLVELAKLRAAA